MEDVILEATFVYDVFNNLIGRIVDADGDGPTSAEELWTVYDIIHPYADFDAAGTLLSRYLYAEGVDQLMARVDASGNADFYETDNLGSVRKIIEPDGEIINETDYDSFGNLLNEILPENGDRFDYTAREVEAALDLMFYRARWYDAAIGRFISEDPIGFNAGDANLSRYVMNRPTGTVDPLGLDAVINHSGIHTDISVEVRDAQGNIIGYLTASYQAKSWGDDGSCGCLASAYDPGLLKLYFRREPSSGRPVNGTPAQDAQLLDWILEQAGMDVSSFMEEVDGGDTYWEIESPGDYGTYNAASQNCNDFTDAALDVYLGYDWLHDIIWTGDDLVEAWDDRFDSNGNPRVHPFKELWDPNDSWVFELFP
jgi:RHS repeat-associated protein